MDVSINLWAVLAATATQFIAAGIWYTPIFGKKWGEIHDFDKLDKKTQARMQQQMLPLMLAQFVVGAVSAVVLAHFIAALPSVEWWKLAFWLWLGFVLPTQFGAVVFGGTEPRWVRTKLAIMAGGGLLTIMLGAWVISLFA